MSFVSERYSFGYCDRCGFRYPTKELKFEVENGFQTKRKTCPDCHDPDHPQNFLGKLKIRDPQSIRDARPEIDIESSRSTFGWNPVGSFKIIMTVSVGEVSVTT